MNSVIKSLTVLTVLTLVFVTLVYSIYFSSIQISVKPLAFAQGTNIEDYVDQTSNVDGQADKGTHSNFTAEQYGPDSIYDTLTEANTGVPDVYYLSSTSLTGFGTDYRALTTTSGTADTTTSIKHAKNTGYFYFDPFTSSSTATGTPSATALKGYGWRSNGVYGKVIPAGTWEFNLTLQESSATGTGYIAIWVYSCTTTGTSVTNLFSKEYTSKNVLATTTTTKYTFTYTSSSSYDLTNLVLVIEYWLHITTAGTSTTGTVKLTTVSIDSSVKVPYTNYQLDLEVQWINVDYSQQNEYLCIYAGTLNSEALKVDVWTGSSWVNVIGSLSASQWNNVSVSTYLTSSTFTIRFIGATESGDTSQSSWQIDCALLHLWTTGYNLNLRVMDYDLTDAISGAYVYKDNDVLVSDSNGWANWTLVSGTVNINISYYGFWVNGTFSVTMDSDKTINVQCNLFDVVVNVRETVRSAKLANVNVTVFNASSTEGNKIKSGISDSNGQIILTNLPNNTLTFTLYGVSSYSLVIGNTTQLINSEGYTFTANANQNYVSTTSYSYLIVYVVGSIFVNPLNEGFKSRLSKRIKRIKNRRLKKA